MKAKKTYKMMQKVGDRGSPSISVKDYAFCINANPMSDRQQLVIEIEDSRSENIAFKMMPNGNIRAYQKDKPDKSGVSELQITDPRNEAPTVIVGNVIKIIQYEYDDIQ